MSKSKYRSSLEIQVDVLRAIEDNQVGSGAIISYIARKSNLSHYSVVENIDVLGAGMLIETNGASYGGAPTFRITPEGRQFIENYDRVMEGIRPKRDFSYKSLRNKSKS